MISKNSMYQSKRLAEKEVRQFQAKGYFSPVSVLSATEAQTYREKLEAFETQLGHAVTGPLRSKPHLLFTWVDDLMRNSLILDYIEDLIGPDILCWNSWFWIKEANTTSYVSWHQDSQYWGLDTSNLVTAWIALSPASEQSGCMKVLPASHLGDSLPHQDLYHDDNLLTRGQEITDIDESSAVLMPLQSGQMSLHNIRIAHASAPNKSADRRIGLSLHYMPTDARQLKAEWDSAALVRGVDNFNHFEHTPRPEKDFDPVTSALHEKAMQTMREILFQGAEKIRPTI